MNEDIQNRIKQLIEEEQRLREPIINDSDEAEDRAGKLRRLEEELADALGTRVEIVTGKGAAGRLVIHYGDLDQLDGILGRVGANRL